MCVCGGGEKTECIITKWINSKKREVRRGKKIKQSGNQKGGGKKIANAEKITYAFFFFFFFLPEIINKKTRENKKISR